MARGNPREGRGRGRVSGCLTKGPVKMPCTMRMRWGEAGVEAAEHEVWRSTPSRSAAAGGRRWAVRSGRRWLGRKVGEGARRGKGGVVMHLIGPWGTSCCLCLVGSEGGGGWLGRWWRLAPGHEVVRCFELSTDAGVRQGGSAPVPKAQGGSGRGPGPGQSTVRHQGGGAEGVIVFFYRLPHHLFVALVAEQLTPEGGIKGDRKCGLHLRGHYGVVVSSRGFQ